MSRWAGEQVGRQAGRQADWWAGGEGVSEDKRQSVSRTAGAGGEIEGEVVQLFSCFGCISREHSDWWVSLLFMKCKAYKQ